MEKVGASERERNTFLCSRRQTKRQARQASDEFGGVHSPHEIDQVQDSITLRYADIVECLLSRDARRLLYAVRSVQRSTRTKLSEWYQQWLAGFFLEKEKKIKKRIKR